jgi:hypothetical protein
MARISGDRTIGIRGLYKTQTYAPFVDAWFTLSACVMRLGKYLRLWTTVPLTKGRKRAVERRKYTRCVWVTIPLGITTLRTRVATGGPFLERSLLRSATPGERQGACSTVPRSPSRRAYHYSGHGHDRTSNSQLGNFCRSIRAGWGGRCSAPRNLSDRNRRRAIGQCLIPRFSAHFHDNHPAGGWHRDAEQTGGCDQPAGTPDQFAE